MTTHLNKKPRLENLTVNLFDDLPDDLVISILQKLSSSASSPADFLTVLFTCKRLNRLGLHPLVLSRAGTQTLAVTAAKWSDSAHKFLRLCVNAGNIDACYALGMIRFYCLQNPVSGASLMARAAIKSHAPALYSLSVIQFNGSGGTKSDKNLRAGVALCARSAYLGHVDALRELGHCLQDGYGVSRDVSEGRRVLIQANARELACSLRAYLSHKSGNEKLTDLACSVGGGVGGVPVQEIHPVNRFLKDWFDSGRVVLLDGLRMCSHGGCGRPETRWHEFRRCSVCGKVNYCSRGCQALDWRAKHKMECAPLDLLVAEAAAIGDGDGEVVEVENHAARNRWMGHIYDIPSCCSSFFWLGQFLGRLLVL
ncbi:F-box protein At5g50450 isoform X1 [Eutrema salsugineum]|uniref:F-box protein At5g50450 isoform X1 n=1 Tax=Eutrema salsugineum TaxID=72664 RepID=UPI000CED69A2|nr:F-box protein At5g50450 isoform X1 [Eutrema salsugineum]